MRSWALTSISSRQCSSISGRPINGLWTRGLQLDRPTYAPASRSMTFIPQCSLAVTPYFCSEYY